MWAHLRSTHPSEYSLSASKRSKTGAEPSSKTKSDAYIQPPITAAFERLTSYSRESKKWNNITEKITLMIAQLMLPFSIVEEPTFKQLLHELDPRYSPPSRKHISSVAIPKKFNEVKSRVITDLKEAKHISLTSDGWSSSTMASFLSLTVHYITPSWTLRSYCLRTIYMPESHTGENIAAMIRNILREYDIEMKNCISITTDSGSNMVKACGELPFVRIPCFGHILHNSISTSTKQEKITETLKGVRSIVTTFSHSGKLKLELKKQQKEKGLNQKGLVGEVSTRWGSKYRMMERMYQNREPVQSILLSDRKFAKHNPTWENLQYMETFIQTLQPFSALTDALSGAKSVTISKVYPMIKLVENTCHQDVQFQADISEECVELSKEIRASIWSYVDSRYKGADPDGKLSLLLKVCKNLDPRLSEKDTAVIDEMVVQAVVAELASENGNESGAESRDLTLTAASSVVSRSKASSSDNPDFLMDLLMDVSASAALDSSEEDATTRARKEIDYYLQTSAGMIGKHEDLLSWWGSKGSQFPMMRRVASKYLTCNATSTASERLFSYAGMVCSKKRQSLKPEKVHQLTCLAYNLRSLHD